MRPLTWVEGEGCCTESNHSDCLYHSSSALPPLALAPLVPLPKTWCTHRSLCFQVINTATTWENPMVDLQDCSDIDFTPNGIILCSGYTDLIYVDPPLSGRQKTGMWVSEMSISLFKRKSLPRLILIYFADPWWDGGNEKLWLSNWPFIFKFQVHECIDTHDHTLFIGPPEVKAEVLSRNWATSFRWFPDCILWRDSNQCVQPLVYKCYRLEGGQMSNQERW